MYGSSFGQFLYVAVVFVSFCSLCNYLRHGVEAAVGESGLRLNGESVQAINPINDPKKKNKRTFGSGKQEKLVESLECKDDILRLCDRGLVDNNFAVLECLQNDKRQEDADISDTCHHLIWTYKRNLTRDERFESTAHQICSKLMAEHPECKAKPGIQGQLLSCLIQSGENVTDGSACRSFLNRMETIIFSDYRLIYKFSDACDADILKLQCGRVEAANDPSVPHSQAATIECLTKKTEDLGDLCRHEILRIAELQGNDFHLDRPLYFACRDDRERFCKSVASGDGRVYRCLIRHKLDREMSQECQEKLYQREKLVIHDYKVNRGLAKACKEDIKMYHCRDDTSDKREFRLSQILLCLENAIHKGYTVVGECRAEMREHRKMLMENYKLTPNLAANCEHDIEIFCRRLETKGKTIHCLMDHARPMRRGNSRPSRISDLCRRELEALLKEADVAENWQVDPILQEACQNQVKLICDGVPSGEGRVLSCLMDHLDSPQMSDVCKEKLLVIQYFAARDFHLDFMLYKECMSDAEKHCHAKKEWHDRPNRHDPDRGPTVLSCLYRYAYHPDQNWKLGRSCLYEVKRVMRQRSVSVNLLPEVEEPCIKDLSESCSKNVDKGQEMSCLQDKINTLQEECKVAIYNFTLEEAEHVELNYPLYKACQPVIKVYCSDQASKDVDQGDMMQCLIANKNTPEMKTHQKCRVSVEHFQLISLKDYRFSFKFKEACKADVLSFCSKVKTKWEVVSCLSGIVMNNTLRNSRQKISRICRDQLRTELLQRSENINLDPKLHEACKQDQQTFCKNTSPGEAQILECLKNNQRALSNLCREALFKREQVEMADNAVDYTLITTCKSDIRKFCADEESSQVLHCLKRFRYDAEMGQQCQKLVVKRLVEQNSDYRLNVRIKTACIKDIPKFCSAIIDQEKQDELFEGKVITCLKKEYLKDNLTPSCGPEVLSLIRDSAKTFELDPVLTKACSEELQKKCLDESREVECLKQQFQKKEIKNEDCVKEVSRLIYEGKADIQSDPVLYKACVLDLKHYCSDIPAGHGQQLSCLLAALEMGTSSLSLQCKTLLSKRLEMFEYAAQLALPENMAELVQQVTNSPARNYFIVVALGMLGVIFIGGLFCGRVTKRVPVNMKNK